MAEIYRTASEVEKPMPALSSAGTARTASVVALADWVDEHLIGEMHPVHQLCFQIGRNGALFFSPWLGRQEQQAFVQSHGEALAIPLRNALGALLAKEELLDLDLASMPALRRFLRALHNGAKSDLFDSVPPLDSISAEALLAAFRDHGLDGLDEMIPAVLHTVAPLTGLAIDWVGMRESICAMFDSGCRWPTVFLRQNGSFGVGEVGPALQAVLNPVQDPAREVYFLDEKAGVHVAVKISWPELEKLLGQPPVPK
jgi:hypothetical protein